MNKYFVQISTIALSTGLLLGCGPTEVTGQSTDTFETAQVGPEQNITQARFYYLTDDGVFGSAYASDTDLASGLFELREFDDISWLNGYDSLPRAVAADGFEHNQFYVAFVNTSVAGSSLRIVQMGGAESGTEIAYIEDNRFTHQSTLDLSARCDGALALRVDNAHFVIDIETADVQEVQASGYLSLSNEVEDAFWACDASNDLRSVDGINNDITSNIKCSALAASRAGTLWGYYNGQIQNIALGDDIVELETVYDFSRQNVIELAPVSGFCLN